MELKFVHLHLEEKERTRFNRTFMELKYENRTKMLGTCRVLIVPLWNWNDRPYTYYDLNENVLIVPLWNWNRTIASWANDSKGFNRTFMELKYNTILIDKSSKTCFNRTFMELKYIIFRKIDENRKF